MSRRLTQEERIANNLDKKERKDNKRKQKYRKETLQLKLRKIEEDLQCKEDREKLDQLFYEAEKQKELESIKEELKQLEESMHNVFNVEEKEDGEEIEWEDDE